MRLTLRTLLAYRDRVLNPAEMDDMHRRVQQSPTAGKLVKRIDELAARKQILAPPVDGKGLGSDANSIAEYLDDTLRKDQVPELERICLESDSQLSELAQCHNLLTTAMLTAVEVPAQLRDRVLRLADPAERDRLLAQRSMSADELPAVRSQHDGVITTGGAWRVDDAMMRSDPAHAKDSSRKAESAPVSSSAERGEESKAVMVKALPIEAPMMASGGDSIRTTGLDLEGAQLAHEVPEYLKGRSGDGWRSVAVMTLLVGLLLALTWASIGSLDSVKQLLAGKPKDKSEQSESTTAHSNVAASSDTDAERTSNVGGAAGGVAEGSVRPEGNMNDRDVRATSESSGSMSESKGNAGDLKTKTAATIPAESSSAVTPSVANSPSQDRLVAAWQPADDAAARAIVLRKAAEGVAQRLSSGAGIVAGERLVIPPASRPMFTLSGGAGWQVCGPTIMSMSKGEQDRLEVQLLFGRAMIQTTAPQQLRLITAAGVCDLSLAAGAAVAVEMIRVNSGRGSLIDPQSVWPIMTITSVEGTLLCSDVPGASTPTTVIAGKTLVVEPALRSFSDMTSPPAWSSVDSERPIDLQAAEDINKRLNADATVSKVLLESAAGRRPETAAMAAMTAAMLGDWNWAAAEKNVINDPRARSHWTMVIDLVRQVLAAQPNEADLAINALCAREPDKSELRRAMLLDYSQGDLKSGGASKLVAALESNSLIDRVLAIHHLMRATGKDFGYQPAEPNLASIQQWQKEIIDGPLGPTKPAQ
ncbi:MAG: hypothetical protein U0892_09265 [Pirellulales bacterium]